MTRTVFDRDYKLIHNILWPLPYEPVDFNNRSMERDLEQRYQNRELPKRFEDQLFSHPRPMFELYDRKADPAELHNLAGQSSYEAIEYNLKGELHEWMIRYQDYANLLIPHKEMVPPAGELKAR
ncbi:MAG: DUF4976 domain-containing protein [Saprospiraceae bacterium]|nr:DUF4976 domain-containing protein [Saprospiraceae bacterium]